MENKETYLSVLIISLGLHINLNVLIEKEMS
jgi:hypothetical protein